MGRKQQQKERRLIKGFNIGMVENANFSLSSSAGNKAADFFSGILLGKRKQSSKKKVMYIWGVCEDIRSLSECEKAPNLKAR